MNTPRTAPPQDIRVPDNAGRLALNRADNVEGLLRDFASTVLQAQTAEAVIGAVQNMAETFAGMDPSYSLLDGWHDRAHLGMALCKRLGVDPAMNYFDILRASFAIYAKQTRDIAQNEEDTPDETIQWQVETGIEYMTSLLLGTIDLTHPEVP